MLQTVRLVEKLLGVARGVVEVMGLPLACLDRFDLRWLERKVDELNQLSLGGVGRACWGRVAGFFGVSREKDMLVEMIRRREVRRGRVYLEAEVRWRWLDRRK